MQQQKYQDPLAQSSYKRVLALVYLVFCVLTAALLVSMVVWVIFAPESMYPFISDTSQVLFTVLIGTWLLLVFTLYPSLSWLVKKVIQTILIVISFIIFLIIVIGEEVAVLLFILNDLLEE